MARHYAENRLAQRRRYGLLVARSVAPTRFGNDFAVAERTQGLDETRAQDRNRVELVFVSSPAHALQHRSEPADCERAQTRLPLALAVVIIVEPIEDGGDPAPHLRIGVRRRSERQLQNVRRRLQPREAESPA